jgi:hypothetical protein
MWEAYRRAFMGALQRVLHCLMGNTDANFVQPAGPQVIALQGVVLAVTGGDEQHRRLTQLPLLLR